MFTRSSAAVSPQTVHLSIYWSNTECLINERSSINVSLYLHTISFLLEVTHHPLAFASSRQDLCRGCLTADGRLWALQLQWRGVSCLKYAPYKSDKTCVTVILYAKVGMTHLKNFLNFEIKRKRVQVSHMSLPYHCPTITSFGDVV